jgi:hypothetical protein
MILRFLFYAFLIYLAYKLVFHFIIPVIRTTRQVKKGFREMKEKMEQHQHNGFEESPPSQERGKDKPGEYIDYEEVKD